MSKTPGLSLTFSQQLPERQIVIVKPAETVNVQFGLEDVQRGLKFYVDKLMDMGVRSKQDGSVIEYPSEARKDPKKTQPEREKYETAFNNQRMTSLILSEASRQGMVGDLLGALDPDTGITMRETLANKGYMVALGQDKDNKDVTSIVSHWDLHHGNMLNPYDVENPVALPPDIRGPRQWKRTFEAELANEALQERSVISAFASGFAARQQETGFAPDDQIVIFDTRLSSIKRAVGLINETTKQFAGKDIVYTGVGFKQDDVAELRTALDSLGIRNDLRVGTFGQGIEDGRIYTPKNGTPYSDMQKADIVFNPFGVRGVTQGASDAIGAVLKDSGIVISLTNTGHTLSRIKNAIHKDKFRPGDAAPSAELPGTAKFDYTSRIRLPAVPPVFWAEMLEMNRASFGGMRDASKQTIRDILSFVYDLDLTALPREDRKAVLQSTRSALSVSDNCIDSNITISIAPGRNASEELRVGIAASMPSPPRDTPRGPTVLRLAA
jgi:hypothetical protein